MRDHCNYRRGHFIMVKFKVIKYKHYRRALELTAREDVDDATAEDEHFRFLLGLVKEWDFRDGETEDPITPGVESIDELTIAQFNEVTTAFNKIFSTSTAVPKVSAGHSLSISTPLDQVESQERPLSGYPPLS